MKCCLEFLRQHCIRFWPVQCWPKSIKTTLNRFFIQCCLGGASWTSLHRILIYAIFPKSIKTTLNRIFSCPMLSGASPITLHRAWPMQCCSQSIKTKLQQIFSYAMLSGAYRKTWYSVYTCTMLYWEY